MTQRASRYPYGFTLFEMMVAIAIFAILSVMTFQALDTSTRVQQRIESKAAAIKEVQLLMGMLHKDLIYFIRRPVRDAFGNATYPAFNTDIEPQTAGEKIFSDCKLALTRSSSPQSEGALRAGLVRIMYCLDPEDNLYRLTWRTLDRAQDSQPIASLLLQGVDEFSIELAEEDVEDLQRYCDAPADNMPPQCLTWAPSGAITATLALKDDVGGQPQRFQRDFPMNMGFYLWYQPR